MVLSKSDVTGEISYKRVVNTFIRQTQAIYKVTFEDGTILETTWNHPFRRLKTDGVASLLLDRGQIESMDLSEWTEAKKLKSGDLTFTADGKLLAISSIEVDGREETVYNFEVEEYHTYFVGEIGVWVHNDERYHTSVRVFAPFKSFGPFTDFPIQDRYHGDDRGFSEEEGASSRIHDKLTVDIESGEITGFPGSDPTIFDAFLFKIEGTATNKLNKNHTEKLPDGTLVIERSYSGGNPYGTPFDSHANQFFGRGVSPEIDVNYKLSIKENKNSVNVKLNVTGDAFPAAEAIILDRNKTNSVIISTFGVSRFANPITHLYGENNRPMMNANININKDKNGNFSSVSHNGQQMSISEWNQKQKMNCTRKQFNGSCP